MLEQYIFNFKEMELELANNKNIQSGTLHSVDTDLVNMIWNWKYEVNIGKIYY